MAENDRVEKSDAATRRTVLRGALIAGVATPLLAACGSNDSSAGGGTTKSSTPTQPGATGGGAAALTKTADVPQGSGTIFTDAGVVVTQPKPGEFKGFTNICTHMGCPVANVTNTINCNCHGSQYSIADGSVVTGPAPKALAEKPLKVSGTDIALA